MKKILLISNNGLGFYNFKKELVEELVSIGFEVHFSVPFYSKLNELEAAGVKYHPLTIDRRGIHPVKDLALIKQLNRLMSRVRPDVLILHTIKPNIYGGFLARMRGIPCINNITGLGSALQNESKLAKLLRVMYRYSLRNSHGVFFENQGNCDYFKKYRIGNQEKYIVVNGAGVNTKYYSRADAGGVHEGITFLFIGRVMREKGIEEYLQTAQMIKRKYSDWDIRFQVLGPIEEPLYEKTFMEFERQDVIEYLGESTDTRKQMKEAQCIVLPSYHEGMSNVLLEGASFGLPLITTNICGCREAVDDGTTGFLCEPKNSESLFSAMENFLSLSEEERQEMGRRGREKMIREFDRKSVVDEYIGCIQGIFNKA